MLRASILLSLIALALCQHESHSGQWKKLTYSGDYSPPARYFSAFTPVGRQATVFGGATLDGTYLSDLFTYNTANGHLKLLSNYGPAARAGACAVTLDRITEEVRDPDTNETVTVIVRNETFVLFGGEDGDNYYNDIWTFTFGLEEWKQYTGSTPPNRAYHDCVVAGDLGAEIISVFGGVNQNGDYLGVDHFMHYNLSSAKWTMWENNSPAGVAPSGRAYISGYSTKFEFVLYGGYDGDSCLSDTWAFQYETQSWFSVPIAVHPNPNAGYSGSFVNGDYDIFGGLQDCSTPGNEIATLSHADFSWDPIQVTGPNAPPPARFGAMTLGSSTHLYAFGGASGSIVNGTLTVDAVFDDLWVFQFSKK